MNDGLTVSGEVKWQEKRTTVEVMLGFKREVQWAEGEDVEGQGGVRGSDKGKCRN